MFSLQKIGHNLSIFGQAFSSALDEAWGWVFIRSLLIVALIVNILDWAGATLLYRALGDNLTVLHYNVNFGIDLIGPRRQVFINPLLGLIFLILNFSLVLFLAKNKHFRFSAHVLLNTAVVVNILLLLAIFSVYLINFR